MPTPSLPNPYAQKKRSSPPSKTRSLPDRKKSHSFNSKARQKAYLDEKRRQKAMGAMDASKQDKDPSTSNTTGSDESESTSHHDPLHLMMSHSSDSHNNSSNHNNPFDPEASSSSINSMMSFASMSRSKARLSSSSRQPQQPDSPSSSESHAENNPLHITPSGMSLTDAKASATSMSRKFLFTPPERLQVDQSQNLMDVERANYEFETSHHKRKLQLQIDSSGILHPPTSTTNVTANPTSSPTQRPGSGFAQFLTKSLSIRGLPSPPSSTTTTATTTRRDSMQRSRMMSIRLDPVVLGGVSTGSTLKKNHAEITVKRRIVEAFLDEETGTSNTNGGSNKGRRNSKRKSSKKKKNKKQPFPDGYDPNQWEQRAVDAKSQPLLTSTDVDDSEDDAKARRRRSRRRQRRQRHLRPGRVALVTGGLFVLIAIVLLILVITGKVMWTSWHSPTSNNNGPTELLERNHSYLNVPSLPTSSQIMTLQIGTPQQQALQWLKEDPKTTLVTDDEDGNANDSDGHSDPLDTLAALQKFVLATLYYHTNGPDWDLQGSASNNWMDLQLNECNWFGLEDAQLVHNSYTVCNRYHQLHALPLNSFNLKGQLPTEELALLSNLRHLDLGNNTLTGILPGVWFQDWKNLEHFSVEHNSFEGQLPTELGLLTNSNGLRVLRFGNNHFTGTIPTELGGLMNHLVSFIAPSNQLTGSIPTELGGVGLKHRSLGRLRLNNNLLTGRIPSELGLLTQMTALMLHRNPELEPQTLPQEICDLPLLDTITVDCDIVTCPDGCICDCHFSGGMQTAATAKDDNTESSTHKNIHHVESESAPEQQMAEHAESRAADAANKEHHQTTTGLEDHAESRAAGRSSHKEIHHANSESTIERLKEHAESRAAGGSTHNKIHHVDSEATVEHGGEQAESGADEAAEEHHNNAMKRLEQHAQARAAGRSTKPIHHHGNTRRYLRSHRDSL